MSLETGQILQDIGLCHDFTFLGAKIGSLATIPSPRTAGVCPPHARGGGPTPPEASPHARGGVPTPPEASPHARGGVGRGEKRAPLPGSDVRLLRHRGGARPRVKHSLSGQLRALTVGRQKTRLRGSRHTNPRYPTRPKDIHLENLEREPTYGKPRKVTRFYPPTPVRAYLS